MNHFTDRNGYNGIRAVSPWCFRAGQPPGGRPFGVFFTTLPRETKFLARRLRIPKRKLEYVFTFVDIGDLLPLLGRRGLWIFYSPSDYYVTEDRQLYCGKAVQP